MDLSAAIKTSFSKVLKKYRAETGISQKELSDKAGLHRNEIGLIERKKRAPSVETIIKIARGLEIQNREFFDEFLKDLNNNIE